MTFTGRKTFRLAFRKALRRLVAASLVAFACSLPAAADTVALENIVETAGGEVEGTTVVVKRLSDEQLWIANPERANLRYSPASTSKIPHSLIALENGLATTETVFEWDGLPKGPRRWNRDHTLASAFQNSVVWVFQAIARSAGSAVISEGLKRFDYGNANIGTLDQLTTYWVDDTLTISALEQAEFLSNIARRRLPLSDATYEAARDIMVSDKNPTWVLRSKTGWRYNENDMDIGWFVGWLECSDETHVIALNMDMPDTRYLSKRKTIAYTVLENIGAFDCD